LLEGWLLCFDTSSVGRGCLFASQMPINRKQFFDGFRNRIDSTIEQEQVDGLEFLLGKMESDPFWVDPRQIAYCLATVFHETAGSFQPVEEGYYLGRGAKAFQKKLRYFPYFGRGYVQLTWKKNYQRADRAFGTNSVANPSLALDPIFAYKTLTYGMHQGWFTTKKLTDYINETECDYVNARRIVNGTDKAGMIAGYARSFEKILKNSVTHSERIDGTKPPVQSASEPTVDNPITNSPDESLPNTTPPQADNQTIVDVPPVVTDQPEGLVSKVKGWYAALPAFLTASLGGFIAWLQGAATSIIIAFFVTAGVIAIVYIVATFLTKNAREKREHDAAQKQKDRDFELTKIQLLSAADPARQTVRVAAPVTLLPDPNIPEGQ
jgi:putative chitinase